jgi:hypothetical protein
MRQNRYDWLFDETALPKTGVTFAGRVTCLDHDSLILISDRSILPPQRSPTGIPIVAMQVSLAKGRDGVSSEALTQTNEQSGPS